MSASLGVGRQIEKRTISLGEGRTVTTADVAILLVYGGVMAYFVSRFARFWRWPSLGVAMLPIGWVLLALEEHAAERVVDATKWAGVGAGLLLLFMVLAADRSETR
ncbi:MAG: hypothetical protein WAZ94_15315 [Phycisphaerales bacterium]|nr:hypothetical protein [Chloroflexota bacterium]